jgi:dTDP-4-dehydrorhamnose 3,5-epimerase-like enzyme
MSCSTIQISDECNTAAFGIDGLRFEPNLVLHGDVSDGVRETKILSNTGGVVGHFVTHAPDFEYRDYGVHVGQVDRLTFVSAAPQVITGVFIDCRKRSATLGHKVRLSFTASPSRKLVIPPGVAHTFENIQNVVTRNDLSVYCDAFNTAWNVEDDNLTLALDIAGEDVPALDTNVHPLPFAAAVMFYRMQQHLLRGGRNVTEHVIEADIGGARRAVVASHEKHSAPVRMPAVPGGSRVPGFGFEHNAYLATVANSFAVLPGTDSCVMDFVVLEAAPPTGEAPFALHTRHDVMHTFLDRTGEELVVDIVDLRRDSGARGERTSVTFECDPRAHVRIPAGVAYRYRGGGAFAARVEYALFLDENEPRPDLPPIDADRIMIRRGDLLWRDGVVTPKVPAPPEALWFLARRETETVDRMEHE